MDVFADKIKQIIYLTADSPNVLGNNLDKDKIYIIGGISDNSNALKVKKELWC